MPRHFLRRPLEQGGSPLPAGGRCAVLRASLWILGSSAWPIRPRDVQKQRVPGKAGELRSPRLAPFWRSGEALVKSRCFTPAAAVLSLGLFVQAFTETATVAVHFLPVRAACAGKEGAECKIFARPPPVGSTPPAAHRRVTGRALQPLQSLLTGGQRWGRRRRPGCGQWGAEVLRMPAWVLGPATLLQALLVSHPRGPGQAGTLLPRCQPGGRQARAYS